MASILTSLSMIHDILKHLPEYVLPTDSMRALYVAKITTRASAQVGPRRSDDISPSMDVDHFASTALHLREESIIQIPSLNYGHEIGRPHNKHGIKERHGMPTLGVVSIWKNTKSH